MTRKDYELIATVLKRNQANIGNAFTKWESICSDMANTLVSTNPRFDKQRFLKACGINNE